MSSQHRHPIDYATFKRRSRRLRAFTQSVMAIAWFNIFLAFCFIACMLLISLGSYWRS